MKITFQLDSPLLFKYCDARGVDILQNLRLKVTPPIEFNDPFEFMPKVDTKFTRDGIEKRLSSTRLLRGFWRKISSDLDFETFREAYMKELHRPRARHIRETLIELQRAAAKEKEGVLTFMSRRFGVACYSEIADDILMWAHYAKSHQGVVIGFDVQHRFFRLGQNLMPVIYRSERVDATFDYNGLQLGEPGLSIFRSKSPHWGYEREWRQFFLLRKSAKIQTESGCVLYFQKLPPTVINQVILGFRCSPEIEGAVRDALTHRNLRRVQLRRAVLHERDFRLKLVDA